MTKEEGSGSADPSCGAQSGTTGSALLKSLGFPIKPYPTNTPLGRRHLAHIAGDCIDEVYVAWLYETLSPMAFALRRIKRLTYPQHLSTGVLDISADLCAPLVKQLAPELDRNQTAVVPVPSSTGFSELLAGSLAALLREDGNTVTLRKLIERDNSSTELKEMSHWPTRERLARHSFRVQRGLGGPWTAVLVDDVAASGSSLRSCAIQLRSAGAGVVLAAVACADLNGYRTRFHPKEEKDAYNG